jgi:putative transposase
MTFDPVVHGRHSLRLPDFDYASTGAYFVTLVTHQRRCLFGTIADGTLHPTPLGHFATAAWTASEALRAELRLGSFVVMPNHLHAIVFLQGTTASDAQKPRSRQRSLGSMIGGYKAAVTSHAREIAAIAPGASLWQRNFYEHVIRDEQDFRAIDDYIQDNPRRWSEDAENPDVR